MERECPCKRMGKSRREFCTSVTALGLGAVAAAPAVIAAAGGGLSPLFNESSSGLGTAFDLGPVSLIPDDGTPVKKAIVSDRIDGWTKYTNVAVGAVWLRKVGDNIEAFNVLCPHNGCYIVYDSAAKIFKCPCHNALFQLDGKQSGSSISPRDMDSLDVEIKDGNVFVTFQNFQFGCEEKVAL